MLLSIRGRGCVALVLLATLTACTPTDTGGPVVGAPSPDATGAEVASSAPPSPSAPQAPACPDPCRRRPRTVGAFRTSLAPEASGIAAGVRNPTVLYVLDDGPGTASVVVVGARDGRALGRLHIAGLDGIDTEDLAVGPCAADRPDSCLYIGDIGDNLAARDTITVTRAVEPDLSAGVPTAPLPAETVTWRYPDRPHDAEALLVGADASLAVITKDAGRRKRGAARLYTATSFADTTLRRGRRVRLPSPALPFATAVVGNVVTAADAARGRVVVRTYDALYEFTAPTPDGPFWHFPAWQVREIRGPSEGQGEAVAYAADGCGLFTVGEGSGRITSIPCR